MTKCVKGIEIEQRVKVIEKRLFGNGTKGYFQKVDEVCEYIIQNKEKNRIEGFSRKQFMKVMIGITLALFTAGIGFIAWWIKKSIEIAMQGG